MNWLFQWPCSSFTPESGFLFRAEGPRTSSVLQMVLVGYLHMGRYVGGSSWCQEGWVGTLDSNQEKSLEASVDEERSILSGVYTSFQSQPSETRFFLPTSIVLLPESLSSWCEGERTTLAHCLLQRFLPMTPFTSSLLLASPLQAFKELLSKAGASDIVSFCYFYEKDLREEVKCLECQR